MDINRRFQPVLDYILGWWLKSLICLFTVWPKRKFFTGVLFKVTLFVAYPIYAFVFPEIESRWFAVFEAMVYTLFFSATLIYIHRLISVFPIKIAEELVQLGVCILMVIQGSSVPSVYIIKFVIGVGLISLVASQSPSDKSGFIRGMRDGSWVVALYGFIWAPSYFHIFSHLVLGLFASLAYITEGDGSTSDKRFEPVYVYLLKWWGQSLIYLFTHVPVRKFYSGIFFKVTLFSAYPLYAFISPDEKIRLFAVSEASVYTLFFAATLLYVRRIISIFPIKIAEELLHLVVSCLMFFQAVYYPSTYMIKIIMGVGLVSLIASQSVTDKSGFTRGIRDGSWAVSLSGFIWAPSYVHIISHAALGLFAGVATFTEGRPSLAVPGGGLLPR